jgi:MATE family multidrug resistance protein
MAGAARVRQCRLWAALLVHYAARGGLQALRYPALVRSSFVQRPAAG